MHVYNDRKKIPKLIHSPKISGVNQGISSYLTAIIENDDNKKIRFYLQDIMQAYIEITSNFNLDFYIQPLLKLILQLNASFDSIIKLMRLLYSKLEADNY